MQRDFGGALGLLSIIPVPRAWWVDADWQAGRALIWFPAVGWIIGGLVYTTWWITSKMFPPLIVAALMLIVWVWLTGGLHLDGLIDSCDSLLATVSPERRLEIMKDPRAGSFGVIGVVLVLIGKFAAVISLRDPVVLLIIPVIARALMIVLMLMFPAARTSGMGNAYRQGTKRVWFAALWLIPVIVIHWRATVWIALSGVFTLLFGRWAARRLGGGLTGDVYGATCELVETICLIAATV